MDILRQQKALKGAVLAVKNGGVIVCPTDTVYGFLADASNKKAVDKIYKIKKRPRLKPLPVFVKDFKMAKILAEIDAKQEKILKKYWPGKYTFVLNKKNSKGTIALRIPKHKFVNSLLKKINKPLVQTSVNISDNPVLTKISDIIEQFGETDILVVDGGNLPKRKSSTIIDLAKSKSNILRK